MIWKSLGSASEDLKTDVSFWETAMHLTTDPHTLCCAADTILSGVIRVWRIDLKMDAAQAECYAHRADIQYIDCDFAMR